MNPRVRDPVFASSHEVRRLFNDPVLLTKLRLNLVEPAPFKECLEKLHEKVRNLGDMTAYDEHVEPCVEGLYKQYWERLSPDEIRALATTTLQHPPYYQEKNKRHYACTPQNSPKDFDDWMDFIAHVDNGLAKLAAMHQERAHGCDVPVRPSPSELTRIAWVPVQVWESYFLEGGLVVFRAPMSAAPEPQWSFLDMPPGQKEEGHVPCLFIFNKTITAQAGQLGDPEHPISVFGCGEDEWCLPSNLRCIVEKVELNHEERRTQRGTPVHCVRLVGVHDIKPDRKVLSRTDLPLEKVLTAAFVLGVGLRNAMQRRGVEPMSLDQDPILQPILNLCTSLGKALTFSESVQNAAKAGYVLSGVALVGGAICFAGMGPIAGVSLGIYSAAGFLGGGGILAGSLGAHFKQNKNKDEALARQKADEKAHLINKLQLQHMSEEDVVEAGKVMDRNPQALASHAARCIEKLTSDGSDFSIWIDMFVVSKYTAQLATADGVLMDLFARNSMLEVQNKKFFDAIERVGDHLFEAPPESPQQAAWHASAWEDIIRLKLATTRIIALMGEPDAGKTLFTRQVFGINTAERPGRGESGRTGQMMFYPHPQHCIGYCESYVVDTPGFGDSVESRNDAVRIFAACAEGMAGACCCYWIWKAKRATVSPADDVFKLMLPSCAGIIITQVDTRVQELADDKVREMQEEGFDFKADGAKQELAARQKEVMETVKAEVEGRIRQLCGDIECPPLMYAVLHKDSWACTEENARDSDDSDRDSLPKKWKTAGRDVKKFFELSNSIQLRSAIDRKMGIA